MEDVVNGCVVLCQRVQHSCFSFLPSISLLLLVAQIDHRPTLAVSVSDACVHCDVTINHPKYFEAKVVLLTSFEAKYFSRVADIQTDVGVYPGR